MQGVNLKHVLSPKSIAIIGASREPGKIGNVLVKNLVDAKFSGKIFPVNPSAESIYGLKCYSDVREIPGTVDLAIIAIHAELVPEALTESGKKGVKGAIVISGGFSEAGKPELEKELAKAAKKFGITLIGPNCLGVVNPKEKMDAIFIPTYKMERPNEGGIAFVKQSGAIGSMILDVVAREGFGVSKFISYGNAAAVDETDALEFLANDAETNIVVLYIEGVKRGIEFFKATKKLSKRKPLVVIKAGVTEKGAAAAKSHTAALAGSYAAYRAVFKQNRLIEARSLDEMFDYAKIFTTQPRCTGDRVAVITNGGGMGVLATDALVEEGLRLAEFSPETRKLLRKTMPPLVKDENPLDLVGDADAERFEAAIKAAYEDSGVDAVIVSTLFQRVSLDSHVVDVIINVASRKKKPLINITLGGEYTETQRRALESSGVPSYTSPTSAARSLKKLVDYSRFVSGKKN
ncbi:Acetate--CoA ligase [ADP-forming] I [uncultured archaeon]|nr:Acetate--CoA ligase [ADP-forming] I [uncultured archaeon]